MSNFKKWWNYAKYLYNDDPAAKSIWEVFLLYPGVKALKAHEKSHKLYNKKKFFRARRISEKIKSKTGIEIHPGAKIGENVIIDHGDGIVIGETAIIGDNAHIYQGVSLAGNGNSVNGRRHPKIGKNVLIGAGAKIIGPLNIGDNAKIGAGAVVLQDVPENATAVGVPARIIKH